MGEVLSGRPRRRRSPASPSRCAPRARPSRRSPACSTRCTRTPRRSRSRAACSTSSAPAATARCRSTSPRWRRSSPPGAGARVVKHGNRSASSQSGSADVLEALGMRLDLTPDQVAAVLEQAGITFAFAPTFHPRCATPAVPRRELGIGTIFNFLGPLANPARPQPRRSAAPTPDGAGHGRRLRRARRRRVGLPRRRRPRRAHHDHDLAVWRVHEGVIERSPSTRPRSACRWPPSRTCAAGTRRSTPTSCAACSMARRDRSATRWSSTPARPWRSTTPSVATYSTKIAAAWRVPPRRSTRARPPVPCSAGRRLRLGLIDRDQVSSTQLSPSRRKPTLP
jgi:hypothetical protein